MTEFEAAEKEIPIKIGKFPFVALGKSAASGDTTGFVKWIADAGNDRLIGAQVIGAHASELIAEATMAIESEQTADELSDIIHSHPTLAEAWMEAAMAVNERCINYPPKRKK